MSLIRVPGSGIAVVPGRVDRRGRRGAIRAPTGRRLEVHLNGDLDRLPGARRGLGGDLDGQVQGLDLADPGVGPRSRSAGRFGLPASTWASNFTGTGFGSVDVIARETGMGAPPPRATAIGTWMGYVSPAGAGFRATGTVSTLPPRSASKTGPPTTVSPEAPLLRGGRRALAAGGTGGPGAGEADRHLGGVEPGPLFAAGRRAAGRSCGRPAAAPRECARAAPP